MGPATIVFIALGLAMDAFSVSVSSGCAIKQLKIKHALRIALFFGLFQLVMPLLGWMAGLRLKNFISNIDHWLAFGLLCFIGCKMIYESAIIGEKKKAVDPLDINILLILSIATSIDALAVGLSFSFLDINIAMPVIVIGIVTFLLSCLGVFIGNKVGHFFESKTEVVGGVILIGIGIKILVQHLL